jgi:actin, other eukaryote
MENEIPAVVVDVGSDTIKAGFAGDDAPRVIFPSVVGHIVPFDEGEGLGDSYVGDEALSRRNVFNMKLIHPIKNGVVTSWEAMEKVGFPTRWHSKFVNLMFPIFRFGISRFSTNFESSRKTNQSS